MDFFSSLFVDLRLVWRFLFPISWLLLSSSSFSVLCFLFCLVFFWFSFVTLFVDLISPIPLPEGV